MPTTRTQASASSVEQAIANAAQRTGVDFDFLLAQARVESAMDPEARARASSATGLYQFIESTWLETMKRHGERFGLGDIAQKIATSKGGTAFRCRNLLRYVAQAKPLAMTLHGFKPSAFDELIKASSARCARAGFGIHR